MKNLQIIGESYIYKNPNPAARSKQATFPGVARLANGDLLALFVIGEAFEAANARTYQARSVDQGKSWQFEGAIFPDEKLALRPDFSDCYKPCVLADGSIFAGGYGFDRPDPEESLSDVITRTGNLPPSENVFTRSFDNGKTWTKACKMNLPIEGGVENSGPVVALRNGKLILCAPVFSTQAGLLPGLTFESSDRGASWRRLGDYFTLDHLTAWESRCIETEDNHLAVILWAFDLETNTHRNNYFVTSSDGGRTWNPPVGTGIMGQASNLLYCGKDRLLTIHAHRSSDDIGLYIRLVDISGNSFNVLDTFPLWSNQSLKNSGGSIDKQFASLKFGQPSLLRLDESSLLAYCWCQEDAMLVCKCWSIRIDMEQDGAVSAII